MFLGFPLISRSAARTTSADNPNHLQGDLKLTARPGPGRESGVTGGPAMRTPARRDPREARGGGLGPQAPSPPPPKDPQQVLAPPPPTSQCGISPTSRESRRRRRPGDPRDHPRPPPPNAHLPIPEGVGEQGLSSTDATPPGCGGEGKPEGGAEGVAAVSGSRTGSLLSRATLGVLTPTSPPLPSSSPHPTPTPANCHSERAARPQASPGPTARARPRPLLTSVVAPAAAAEGSESRAERSRLRPI